MRREAGFTLLEVLVAMVILGLAVVTLIQLASQGLRLVKLSGDHQEAVQLADRLTRETDASAERVETGEEGAFQWERQTSRLPVPAELRPPAGTGPELVRVAVIVRWDRGRSLEVATLRTVTIPPGTVR